DVVRGSIGNDEILVAFSVRCCEACRAAGQYLDANDSVGHAVNVGEMKHPWISTGVHGFGENQTVELAVVGWPPNHNTGLIRLTARRSRNEVLLRDIAEMSQVVRGLELHQRLQKISWARDFSRCGGEWSDDHRRRRRSRRSTLSTATPLSSAAL